MYRYRLIDTAGSELEIVVDERTWISERGPVKLSDETTAEVVEVYDDEHGQQGGVVATLALDLV